MTQIHPKEKRISKKYEQSKLEQVTRELKVR